MFRDVPFSWFYRRPKKKGKEGSLKFCKFRENRKSNKKFYCNKNNTVTIITRIKILTKFGKVQTYKDEGKEGSREVCKFPKNRQSNKNFFLIIKILSLINSFTPLGCSFEWLEVQLVRKVLGRICWNPSLQLNTSSHIEQSWYHGGLMGNTQGQHALYVTTRYTYRYSANEQIMRILHRNGFLFSNIWQFLGPFLLKGLFSWN